MPFGIASALGIMGLGLAPYSGNATRQQDQWQAGSVTGGNLFYAAQQQQLAQGLLGQPLPMEVYDALAQAFVLMPPRDVEAAPPPDPTPHVVLDLSDAAEIREPKIAVRAVDIEGNE